MAAELTKPYPVHRPRAARYGSPLPSARDDGSYLVVTEVRQTKVASLSRHGMEDTDGKCQTIPARMGGGILQLNVCMSASGRL